MDAENAKLTSDLESAVRRHAECEKELAALRAQFDEVKQENLQRRFAEGGPWQDEYLRLQQRAETAEANLAKVEAKLREALLDVDYLREALRSALHVEPAREDNPRTRAEEEAEKYPLIDDEAADGIKPLGRVSAAQFIYMGDPNDAQYDNLLLRNTMALNPPPPEVAEWLALQMGPTFTGLVEANADAWANGSGAYGVTDLGVLLFTGRSEQHQYDVYGHFTGGVLERVYIELGAAKRGESDA